MEKFLTENKTSLGAKFNKEKNCVEFKLFSKNATAVKLCIFDKPKNEAPILTLDMKQIEPNIWFTDVKNYILNCENRPVFYGFRVFGPNWQYKSNYEIGSNIGFVSKFDEKNNRFCPNKIAYDPYCLELSHIATDESLEMNLFRSGGNYHLIDNAKVAIKSVFKPQKNTEITKIKPRPFLNEVIGEVHIKDLTQLLDIEEKGTYKGAGKFASKIKELGITMIEFLPVNEYDFRQNGGNYWGYMPLGYFSLARKYAFDKTHGNLLGEFREMIDEFHKNDIKVCLDMVYNHTGEAGVRNNNPNDVNLLSYALIDNQTYYKNYDNGYYRSNSGCGNDFNIGEEHVMNLVVDSLEFWVNQGIDAFRFDLASALLENSNTCQENYDKINSLAGQLKNRLKEKNINVIDDFSSNQEGIVLIAEPWTCGGKDCYQLGNFPDFWAEWNDISRDTLRKITLREKDITPAQMRNIFEGTPSKFNTNKSINFIASHDGFTLFDLNTFKSKNPTTKGGSEWEICGDYNKDEHKQQNAIRKQLAMLFLSNGIPMIQIGDIIAHSKQGNNNSYDKDNEINYLNWKKAFEIGTFENKTMEFVKNLINFRKENNIFKNKKLAQKLTYHYDNGEIADNSNEGYWKNTNDVFFGILMDDFEKRIYIATSKSPDNLEITLPKNLDNKNWYKCLDTSNLEDLTIEIKDYIEKKYILNPHSLTIFMEK